MFFTGIFHVYHRLHLQQVFPENIAGLLEAGVEVVYNPDLQSTLNGDGTNFGVGVGEARPEGPRAGVGVLGEWTASPSPATRGFVGAL